MIQDIAPHQLDNYFKVQTPMYSDRLFIFRDKKVLVRKTDGDIAIPLFSNITPYWPEVSDYARYLFSIDEENFFLVDESKANIVLPSEYGLENINIFRTMEPQHLGFAGITAHQLYRWYEDNAFCGRCSHPMIDSTIERARCCPTCGYITYPHISPAIIVAITDGERLLMAKNGYYQHFALIAGFVEFGETFEDTVRREIYEEVGLKVKNIRYYKSQPWAFSGTEMVGFFADLDGDDTITLRDNELQDAKWVSYDEIPQNRDHLSIAQEMIEIVRQRKHTTLNNR